VNPVNGSFSAIKDILRRSVKAREGGAEQQQQQLQQQQERSYNNSSMTETKCLLIYYGLIRKSELGSINTLSLQRFGFAIALTPSP